jgi:predicted DCC family thiol-disulfide oxidoreductase YuxK
VPIPAAFRFCGRRWDNRGVESESCPIVVYDGECPRCVRAASWAARHAKASAVAWQDLDDPASLGLTREQVDESVWWVTGDERHGGASAVARALGAAGGPWRVLGRAIERRPLRRLAEAAYRFAARHRKRVVSDR